MSVHRLPGIILACLMPSVDVSAVQGADGDDTGLMTRYISRDLISRIAFYKI